MKELIKRGLARLLLVESQVANGDRELQRRVGKLPRLPLLVGPRKPVRTDKQERTGLTSPVFLLQFKFSALQLGQQILRMDRLGEDLEFMALGASALEQVCGSGLAGE